MAEENELVVDIAEFEQNSEGDLVGTFSDFKKNRENPSLTFTNSLTGKHPIAVVQKKADADTVIFDMEGKYVGKDGYTTLWYMP